LGFRSADRRVPRCDLSAPCHSPVSRWRMRAPGLHPVNREDRANRASAVPTAGCRVATCSHHATGQRVGGGCEHPHTNPVKREDRANRAAVAAAAGRRVATCRHHANGQRAGGGCEHPHTNPVNREDRANRAAAAPTAGRRVATCPHHAIGWPVCRWRMRAPGLHPVNREDCANRASAAPAGGCLGAVAGTVGTPPHPRRFAPRPLPSGRGEE